MPSHDGRVVARRWLAYPRRVSAPLPRCLLFVLWSASACGARTGLEGPPDAAVEAAPDAAEPPDAGPGDVPLQPPSCGRQTPVGSVRFAVAGVTGHAAIDADGTIYAPYETAERGRGVVALDACGRERWREPAVRPSRGGRVLGGEVRLSTGGDVLLTSMYGDAAARGIWRFGRDGEARPPYPAVDAVVRFVGLPPGRGPVLVTQGAMTTVGRLAAFDLEGRQTLDAPDWSNVNECAVSGTVVGCLDTALDLAGGRRLWSEPYEILDGTLRHPLPPAIDGDRIYVAFFGLSSYVLVARELRTGRVLWRVNLARSTRGQVDLLMGAPVVGADGTVYVYVNVHRGGGGASGELVAVRRDGTRAWGFGASATRTDYQRYATHAVGRAGVIYLAVGRALYAVGEDGRLRWTLAIPEGANASAPVLSPNGDLALHTDDDRLLVVATESAGAAPSAWPLTGGDARNGNAR